MCDVLVLGMHRKVFLWNVSYCGKVFELFLLLDCVRNAQHRAMSGVCMHMQADLHTVSDS